MNSKFFVIIGVIVLASISAISGWRYMQEREGARLELASNAYELVLEALRKNEVEKVNTEAKALMQNYEKTPYSPLAALVLAKVAIEKNDLNAATDYLRFTIAESEKAKNNAILHIAKVRLAKVLAQNQQYPEALALLKAENGNGYAALYEDTKGDIFFKQQDLNEAKNAYLAAVKAVPPGVNVPWLRLKNIDLNADKVDTVK